jgi:hypothetical protein
MKQVNSAVPLGENWLSLLLLMIIWTAARHQQVRIVQFQNMIKFPFAAENAFENVPSP